MLDIQRTVIAELFSDPSLGAQRMEVAAGQTLFTVDQPAETVYYLVQGQVRTYQLGPDGSVSLSDILGPGDWFGAAALGRLPVHRTQAQAAVPSVVLAAPADRVLQLLAQRPDASAQMIRQLVLRLQSAREQAAHLVFDDCNQRLLKTLVRFSRSAAATPQGDEVVLHITHQQLAQAVGVARETVSLALTQLRRQNLLRTGRNRLIFDPRRLEEHAQQQVGRKDEEREAFESSSTAKQTTGAL